MHEYFGIDLPSVWQVVTVDIIELKKQLTDLQV
ncbi:MAG: HepT-like ribonuclease domain-containing protein [Bacteroidota bacterium]